MILVELKNDLFFVVVRWTYFNKFFKIEEFKYLIFPMWYTDKKLSDLTASLYFIYFALVLLCRIELQWSIFI